MTEHLLALELGPVVQLIAAARKTRDLFFASWMLSEIAKSAARAAADHCGPPGREHEALIVPAPASLAQLDDPQFAIGDEILLRVPAGVPPEQVAAAARQAAHDRWLKFASEARDAVRGEERRVRQRLIRDDAWNEQTSAELDVETAGEVVELYAAWVPLTGDYQQCLRQVKRSLFGRTACRNFPPASSQAGIPKSSLDGRRNSVLLPPQDIRRPLKNRKLRLNRGEQLDALGVTKRVGGGLKNFPSTARLAAEPWILGASRGQDPKFQQLKQACSQLSAQPGQDDPLLGKVAVDPGQFPNYPHYASFPYEGAILYANRHHEFAEEAADDAQDLDQTESRLEPLRRALRAVVQDRGEPGAYYVALVADGDGVGNLLLDCRTPEAHRQFSERLSAFAGGVRAIVDQHHGALVFAAGEDVTALLPLHSAIHCADELRRQFDQVINGPETQRRATLSVGLAIGHFLDALEDTLAAARAMEGTAKQGQKNALAVQYQPRGGAAISFRASWTSDPLTEINTWIDLLDRNVLPDKVAYDLRKVAELYRDWPAAEEPDADLRQRALRADLLRLLSRKRKETRSEVQPWIQSIATPDAVFDLAHKIIIAGVILTARQQAAGGNR